MNDNMNEVIFHNKQIESPLFTYDCSAINDRWIDINDESFRKKTYKLARSKLVNECALDLRLAGRQQHKKIHLKR